MDEQSIRRLVGKIFVIGFDGYQVHDEIRRMVEAYHVQNIVYFSRNIASAGQVRDLSGNLRRIAQDAGMTDPLTICTDQENGIVRRLPADLLGLPGNMALGAVDREDGVRMAAMATAAALAWCDIDMDLAPVLDVNNNPRNPVIGVRSFSDDPQRVARLGSAWIEAMQQSGRLACAKHFPGHGNTQVDSHKGLPVIDASIEQLEQVEWVPFRAAIARQVAVVMTAHIAFPQGDASGLPATLSAPILQNWLRGRLQFQGAVMTDCLEMDAIAHTVGTESGAVAALRAGADLLLVSHHAAVQRQAMEAVVQAVMDESIPLQRLKEAASRVDRLKAQQIRAGRLEKEPPAGQIRETSRLLSRQALTPWRLPTVLWGRREKPSRIVIVHSPQKENIRVIDQTGPVDQLAALIHAQWPDASQQVLTGEDGWDFAGDPQNDWIVAWVQAPLSASFYDQLNAWGRQGWKVAALVSGLPY
ncbi:MAG: beta-N-acetylhexosaminidase, partial [Firmicutes bacterium]|nr:beta-N-acetylhexosaminidase [Bacillota bacterium]